MNNMTLINPYTLNQLKNMDHRMHSVDHSIRLIRLEYMERRKRKHEEARSKDVYIRQDNVCIDINQETEEQEEKDENKNFITCIFYIIFKLLVSKND